MKHSCKTMSLVLLVCAALIGLSYGRPEKGPIPDCAHEVCPNEIKARGPECASDGHTYVNECDRKCWGKGAEKVKSGPCEEERDQPAPICPEGKCPAEIEARQSGNQECGADGVTYSNECDRYCFGNEIGKQKDGPC